jgi:hypothetical protein
VIAGGLIAVLLAAGTWALLELAKQSAVLDVSLTSESPVVIPEEEPEESPTFTPSFFDDFGDGIDPVWAVHYGDPFIENGRLTSNVGAGIAAGDISWSNYQIEFDVDTTQTDCSFTDSSDSLGIRVDTFDSAFWFVFTSCESAWSLYPGGIFQGVENLIPDTRIEFPGGVKHITVTAEGPKLAAYEDRRLLSSIEDANLAAGGIFLQLEAGTFYDSFRVTLLP